jgi:hypothetical protein
MPIVLDGSNGITTPDVESAGPISGTTGTFTGDLKANGLSTELRPLVLMAAKPSTTGTEVDFTGIPSWAKRITVLFRQVSLAAVGVFGVRLGTSGGFVSTGYSAAGSLVAASTAASAIYTDGFFFANGSVGTATELSGQLSLILLGGNVWCAAGQLTNNTNGTFMATGSIALGGQLDSIRVTTQAGTSAFDLGTINVMYE